MNGQLVSREEPVVENGLRLASIMDLAALKIDAIIERSEKKDYIDLYVIFSVLGAQNVLKEFKLYNPHVSDKSILFALGEVPSARENRSVMPEMLVDISWKEIEGTIKKVGQDFFELKKSLHDKRGPDL